MNFRICGVGSISEYTKYEYAHKHKYRIAQISGSKSISGVHKFIATTEKV